jgi:hypothetical protein
MATVDTPKPILSRDDDQRCVTHPLQSLRGYLRTYVSLEGLAVLCKYLALWFWIGLALDFGVFKVFKVDWVQVFPFAFRAVIFGGLVLGLLAVVARKVLFRLFREFRDGPLALVLERRFPNELGDRLITAVELADPRKSAEYGYSQQMVDRTIHEAAERVGRLPVKEVFNWARLRRYGVRVAVLTVGLYLLVGIAYCAFARTGPGDFVQRFNNVATIWFERNVLLSDSLWPRRAYLELVNFPPSGDLRVGRDAPPPSLRVRALKWVIADKTASEGWRSLRWDDLTRQLIGEDVANTLPEPWRNWTVDQIEQALGGKPDPAWADKATTMGGVFPRLEELAEAPRMARVLRKLIVPDVVIVYYKGDTVRSEQTLKKEASQEYSGVLSDLKESVRFTVNGEDYYTPYKKITIVPPPSLVELQADREEPAYLYQRPPLGGSLKDLRGKKQRFNETPVSLSGTASRLEVFAGSNILLRGKTDKPLRAADGVRMRPREASAPINAPVKIVDSQTFEVRFNNVAAPLDFVFEMIDTDNVVGLRQVVIKPIDDTPPDVDVEVEVIRKTNQGFLITPSARIPFSGKIRDDHGINSIVYHYTLSSVESQTAANSARIAGIFQLSPPNPSGGLSAAGLLNYLAGQTRSAEEDAGKQAQQAPLAAFARRLKDLAADDVSPEELEKRLLNGPQTALLREHTLDPLDEKETSFDVELLGLKVSEIEGQRVVQPRYRMRLWIVATDCNIDTGPGVGQSREKFVFLIVSENELLVEIARSEEGLHLKLEDAVSRLKDAKLKLEQVRAEIPDLKANEFSPMVARLDEIGETLVKSADVSREVLTDYQKILRELQVNRVRPAIVERVEHNICTPLGDINNLQFDLSDKSLATFHKTLEDKNKDIPAADAANKQLQDLIDRLTRVLDAMGDITTINKLIEQLTRIATEEQHAAELFKALHAKLADEILNKQFGDSDKKPDKKEKK